MRGFPNLIPSRLRQALGAMSSAQRKRIRLPHVGAKEIAKHDGILAGYGLSGTKHDLDHEFRMYFQNPTAYQKG